MLHLVKRKSVCFCQGAVREVMTPYTTPRGIVRYFAATRAFEIAPAGQANELVSSVKTPSIQGNIFFASSCSDPSGAKTPTSFAESLSITVHF